MQGEEGWRAGYLAVGLFTFMHAQEGGGLRTWCRCGFSHEFNEFEGRGVVTRLSMPPIIHLVLCLLPGTMQCCPLAWREATMLCCCACLG